MTDDEAILAALDTDPDAFARFYRRHVDALLAELGASDTERAANACAETFATALRHPDRFNPQREAADEWLQRIARGLLARRTIPDRSRRRLGMAPLDPGDGFVDALEDELVAAARFRDRHPPPVLPLRRAGLAAGIAVLAAGAVVAVLAVVGRSERPRLTVRPPPASAQFPLVPMLPLVDCRAPERGSVSFDGIRLLTRDQVDGDRLPTAPSRLPISSFDPRATRAVSTRWSVIHVVPSNRVAASNRCGTDDGPGVCLVADAREFGCFRTADVQAGRAIALTAAGTVIGLVPDEVELLTLEATTTVAAAIPEQNIFEVRFDGAVAGESVRVGFRQADS